MISSNFFFIREGEGCVNLKNKKFVQKFFYKLRKKNYSNII